MNTDISIIILNYKQKGLVKQCIKGIEQCRISVPYEIIVVDNHSQDESLEMIRQYFPSVITIASEKNGGFAYGNNLGIRAAHGNFIVILNPDVAITEGSLEKMKIFLLSHPKVGVVGPKLINPDGSIQNSCRRFPKMYTPALRRTFIGNFHFSKKELSRYLMTDWNHDTNRKVEWLFGACIMITRESIENIGYFDERFFLYFEDCDFCRRCWERGVEVWYMADVELVHYHQQLSNQRAGILSILNLGTRYHITSAVKYFAKYLGVPLPVITQPPQVLDKKSNLS